MASSQTFMHLFFLSIIWTTIAQTLSLDESSSSLKPEAYSARANRLLLPIKMSMAFFTSLLLLIIAICLAKSFYSKIKKSIMKSLSSSIRFHAPLSRTCHETEGLSSNQDLEGHLEDDVLRRRSSTSMEARFSFPSFNSPVDGPFSPLVTCIESRMESPEEEVTVFIPSSVMILPKRQDSIDFSNHQINNKPSRDSCLYHSMTSSIIMSMQREAVITNPSTNPSNNIEEQNALAYFSSNQRNSGSNSGVTDEGCLMFPPSRQSLSNWTSSSSHSLCSSCLCSRVEPPPSYEEAMKQTKPANNQRPSSPRIANSLEHNDQNDHHNHTKVPSSSRYHGNQGLIQEDQERDNKSCKTTSENHSSEGDEEQSVSSTTTTFQFNILHTSLSKADDESRLESRLQQELESNSIDTTRSKAKETQYEEGSRASLTSNSSVVDERNLV